MTKISAYALTAIIIPLTFAGLIILSIALAVLFPFDLAFRFVRSLLLSSH